MEIALSVIKYAFVIALGVEGLLIARAIIGLAREKARAAQAAAE
jgi:hypothetical protein